MTGKVWVTWDDHRRSRVLAEEFECEYIPITSRKPRIIRYPMLACLTCILLAKKRPRYVFCQNPSIVLAALCVILKPLLGFFLVIDRHSNFKFETLSSRSPKWKTFHWLSDFSLRHGNVNIVTNRALADVVESAGGNAAVLPDKIPQLEANNTEPDFFSKTSLFKVVCVTMFDDDEPIQELIQAGAFLQKDAVLYMTGNYSKMYSESEKRKFERQGVSFCGFIAEDIYVSALAHADAVVVLTKKDFILNCGAYEALALNKPLVLADTPTLREYFGKGAIYTDPKIPETIADTISRAINYKKELSARSAKVKVELQQAWSIQFYNVRAQIWMN